MTLSSPIIEGSLDDHVGQSQESPASTRPSAAINAFVTDEENVLARDSPLPPTPSYSPTPSPSFEVIRIYPGCDVEFSEVTTLPSSLNPSPVQRRPSQPPVGSKNSRDPKFERVVLVALAWTFVFICGFGLLLLLVECTHGVYACSLMVFLSLNLGAHLVMNKCVKKRRVRNPVDVVIRGREYESAVFDIPEDGHSSVVQINGRFEISSLRSSQDIFRSELLMNGQIISSTPRRDALSPGTPTLTPASSNMSLTIFGMAGTSYETSLRTRRTPYVSTPSSLNVIQSATSKGSKTAYTTTFTQ